MKWSIVCVRQAASVGSTCPRRCRTESRNNTAYRLDEARDVLAPVYYRFTEGFDTADLIAAKELLDEMNDVCR